jgi:hypothetical protein
MPNHESFAIEVDGRAAGIVVAERGGYTFFASDWTFKEIDRRTFRRVAHAERAVRELLDVTGNA